MQNENKQLTLDNAIELFAQWRTTRSKQQKIPDELWSIVHNLTGRYPLSTILNKLGLNHSQYRASCSNSTSSDNAVSFIGLDVETNSHTQQVLSVKPVNTSCDIELKKPNGTTLIIHNASEQVLSSLVQSFVV